MLPHDSHLAADRADGLLIRSTASLIPTDAPGGAGVGASVPVRRVAERRQPGINRRSVLPVEFFRRMPGGATTYAPLNDPGPDAADAP